MQSKDGFPKLKDMLVNIAKTKLAQTLNEVRAQHLRFAMHHFCVNVFGL